MAANKRIPVKHIRDRAKARYPAKEFCAVCGCTDNLELHHYHGVTNLLLQWQKKNGLTLDTDDEVLAVRDRFIAEHEHELFVSVVVLCVTHHLKLHSVYGKSPALASAGKQEVWVQRQKEKFNGREYEDVVVREAKPESTGYCSSGGRFGLLILGKHSFGSILNNGVREPRY